MNILEKVNAEALKNAKILRVLGIMNSLAIIGMVASLLVWAWYSWDIAWRIFLTSLVISVVTAWLYHTIKKIILEKCKEIVSEIKTDFPIEKKSLFQQRLDDYLKSNK